jgi:hypothetical protein
MSCLVCLLEEPSAAEMLKVLLPRLAPADIHVKYLAFEGKQDLEKQLEKKLRGWLQPETCFLVLRDQDAADCHEVKKNLEKKTSASGQSDRTIIRIACRELESFYLGDLAAVEAGLNLPGLSSKQRRKAFRTPDRLKNAAQELAKLTNNQYQKLSGSRRIAPFLKLDGTNASHSFNILLAGINQAVSTLKAFQPQRPDEEFPAL